MIYFQIMVMIITVKKLLVMIFINKIKMEKITTITLDMMKIILIKIIMFMNLQF
jgi:hypothetical protein